MAEDTGNKSGTGDQDPGGHEDLGPAINDAEARSFANRIRSRITADSDIVITETPSAELLSIVGSTNYGWWEGDDHHEVTCTGRDTTTLLLVKSTYMNGDVSSLVEREYEMGDGKKPYYDEFDSTVLPSGVRTHEHTDLVPSESDTLDIIDEESNMHTLRQGHVDFADRMLNNCVKANLISIDLSRL
jgi:hypothetical protein